MATLRDIKGRIRSVKSTQQITKAMKMVAAARLRRAQENIINSRPYSRKIAQVLNDLLVQEENNFSNPLLMPREINNVAFVVVTSDRGLCGSFNMSIIREAANLIQGEYKNYYDSGNLHLWCVGKKGLDYFSRRNYNITGKYSGIFSKLNFSSASNLIKELSTKYLNNEIDKIVIVYNEFKSVIQQRVVVEQLLPILEIEKPKIPAQQPVDFIYEPDRLSIITNLLPKHLNSQMWRILQESYAAELGAKMTAMDMATENAKELIKGLQLKYNKERQAAITKELLEIVSGANALKGE
ncbi:MAG: ATP synthase F1 subunit gamma [Ignavibacteriales bacterium]|nr:ATP synthase F1 subunit gamma [Ignavibacteriales bacterium]